MTDGLPEPKEDFDHDDYAKMGMHGLDMYDVQGLRYEVWEALNAEYQEREDGNYNLIEYREQSDVDVSRLEDAIHFLHVIDGVPIQEGPTAFVGWFTDGE